MSGRVEYLQLIIFIISISLVYYSFIYIQLSWKKEGADANPGPDSTTTKSPSVSTTTIAKTTTTTAEDTTQTFTQSTAYGFEASWISEKNLLWNLNIFATISVTFTTKSESTITDSVETTTKAAPTTTVATTTLATTTVLDMKQINLFFYSKIVIE